MQTEIEAARALRIRGECAIASWLRAALARREPQARAACLAGEAVCERNGEPRGVQSGADSRQHGIFARERRGADVPRRARDLHLRRHQRNPAHDHRPRSAGHGGSTAATQPAKEAVRWRLPAQNASDKRKRVLSGMRPTGPAAHRAIISARLQNWIEAAGQRGSRMLFFRRRLARADHGLRGHFRRVARKHAGNRHGLAGRGPGSREIARCSCSRACSSMPSCTCCSR